MKKKGYYCSDCGDKPEPGDIAYYCPKHLKKRTPLPKMVELVEEYEYGVLVSRKVDGRDLPILDIANCKSITIVKTMTREEAVNFYGRYA